MKNILAYSAILVLLISCRKKELYSVSVSDNEFYVGESYTFSLDREPKKKVVWYVNDKEAGEGKTIVYTPKEASCGWGCYENIDCRVDSKRVKQSDYLVGKRVNVLDWGSSFCGHDNGFVLLKNYDSTFYFPRMGSSGEGKIGTVNLAQDNHSWFFKVEFDRAFHGRITGELVSSFYYDIGPTQQHSYQVEGTAIRKGDTVSFDFSFDTVQFRADYLVLKQL